MARNAGSLRQLTGIVIRMTDSGRPIQRGECQVSGILRFDDGLL